MPQSYVCLPIHVIFSTKNRLPMIQPEWEARLYDYLGGILRNDRCVLLATGGMTDHVHLLISLGKENSVADLVRDIKANSSRWVHETFADQQSFAWQGGYAAFGVSILHRQSKRASSEDDVPGGIPRLPQATWHPV